MRIIKVAFYKNSKTTFGKLIRLKQRHIEKLPKNIAIYSHVEMCFDDGWYFGSSEVDGGVRAKRIDDLNGDWDYININVTDKQYAVIRSWCESKVGLDYDRLGIFFAQVLKTMWFLRKDKYFCSEYAAEALQQIEMLCSEVGYAVSPGKLFKLLK